jgi:hypothetical protein
MSGEKSYETVELPGVGEIRARAGTSTLELAGAAKFWYDKYQSARTDGFIGGVSLVCIVELVLGTAYYFWSR